MISYGVLESKNFHCSSSDFLYFGRFPTFRPSIFKFSNQKHALASKIRTVQI